MKKIIATIPALSFFLFYPLITLAVNLQDSEIFSASVGGAAGYDVSQGGFEKILRSGVTFILSLLGIIFIGLIIYGGVLWMTSNGNEQKVERAGEIIKQSLIGLIIVLAAYAISYFLFSVFGSQLTGAQ